MILIGITGTLGAGKGTIVRYLVENYHFNHYSVREYLKERAAERGILKPNRDDFTLLANELRRNHSPSYIIDELYRAASLKGENAIIESIRTLGEVEMLRGKGNFYLIAVDAKPEIRYERILKRKSETDKISFATFISNEEREMENSDPHCQNLSACIEQADFLFANNGSVQELEKKVDVMMNEILRKQ
ncbi:MAG TPA: AAA family ATPase [Bacteroidales bacterium]|jgi:dephospho-CoA kinase|nr:AAA family ATPase [Bacteroidales bacterium]HOS57557.1 AAA family ATPase [Bacteroidales bacterium]HXK74269.1 AAA family ATPase [Bacteroidales bacterium]